jgi:hypothetical protein
MTEDGMPDGSDLVGCHRKAVREYFGLSHAQFDEKWQEWVQGD